MPSVVEPKLLREISVEIGGWQIASVPGAVIAQFILASRVSVVLAQSPVEICTHLTRVPVQHFPFPHSSHHLNSLHWLGPTFLILIFFFLPPSQFLAQLHFDRRLFLNFNHILSKIRIIYCLLIQIRTFFLHFDFSYVVGWCFTGLNCLPQGRVAGYLGQLGGLLLRGVKDAQQPHDIFQGSPEGIVHQGHLGSHLLCLLQGKLRGGFGDLAPVQCLVGVCNLHKANNYMVRTFLRQFQILPSMAARSRASVADWTVIINNNNQQTVMIRRRSTVDHTQRARHHRLVEVYAVLDLCLQLPSCDRILLRNQIKSGDEDLTSRIYQCKKDKNYHTLQIYLRKHVAKIKESNKFDVSNNRGRTPQTLNSLKNMTQNSYHNSLQNSLQSSPSAKKAAKTTKTINNAQIMLDSQINESGKGQKGTCQQQQQHQDLNNQEIRVEIRPLQIRRQPNGREQPPYSMKTLLQSKVNGKSHGDEPPRKIEQQVGRERGNESRSERHKLALTLGGRDPAQKENEQQRKYGQFYRRIRKVIEQAH